MKTFKFIILLFICIFIATSCNDDDGYSLGEFRVNMATVKELESADNFYLQLDNGSKLWIAVPAVVGTPKYERVIINYTLLSDSIDGYDHMIRLNGISSILTKDIAYIDPDDEVKQDSIGNDPIKIISIWEGGDYMNIKFGFNYGETKQHLISLIADEPDFDITSEPIKLTFRHNKFNDPERYAIQDYVCYNLKPYKDAAIAAERDKITFEVKVLDFKNEEKTYTVEYNIK